ncbi:MAG TPA: DUF3667 domain-containing protein [Cyclobacteriaceae bacterium]|nr:DUF3667 domain-containing protein [Cyclobacteriaceae bacterium]
MTCINCSAEGEGTFCSHCGQRLEVKRLTWKESLNDFWARIYGFDGMFPRTFKDLTIRPGFAAMEFIKGNRARYYGPVGYFFLMITCFLLLLSIIGLSVIDYMQEMQKVITDQQKEAALNKDIRALVSDNLKLMAFVFIPIQAFCARYVFFRKQNLNFLEHSVLPLYLMGHWYWINMVEALSLRYSGFMFGISLHWIGMAAYMGFGFTSLVTTQPKWKTFMKGVGIYALSFVFMFILILIALIIAMMIDPSIREALKPPK